MNYFATFPAGAYPIILKQLKSFSLDQLQIISNDTSSATFKSNLPASRLSAIRYFTNIFLIIDDLSPVPTDLLNGQFFRLLGLNQGSPQAIQPKLRKKLLQQIEGSYQLKLSTHQSKNNFYYIWRGGGQEFPSLQLPRASFQARSKNPGQLSVPVANILCLAAGLNPKNKVLDMFAGSGSIPYEALQGFGCTNTIASDIKVLPNKSTAKSIKWHTADATNLSFISPNSIDKIITDPPWGVYDTKLNLADLYSGFLKEATRILKPAGIAIILTGYQKFEDHLKESAQLELINSWNVLISGKKATIYKLRKIQPSQSHKY